MNQIFRDLFKLSYGTPNQRQINVIVSSMFGLDLSDESLEMTIECLDNDITALKEKNAHDSYSPDRAVAIRTLDAFRTAVYDALRE